MPDSDPKPDTRHPIPAYPPDTIKETIESIIIAFVLAFVFRAFVVEAFVIPTGSMAPTLLGQHTRLRCADCGYQFNLEVPRSISSSKFAMCPMCGRPISTPNTGDRAAGDRILVHKYLYRFSEPRRWDVVVFKNPAEPTISYIKRLVGLPNESLYLLDGNIYVSPHDDQGQPQPDKWHIVRKTDRPRIQHAVWQPIYHSDYVPADPRIEQATLLQHTWRQPWQPTDPQQWDMTLDGQRTYRFLGRGAGEIRFGFEHWKNNLMGGMYAYDQMHPEGGWADPEPIEDIRLAATVMPEQPDQPLRLELRTTARLDAGPTPITAVIDGDGKVRLLLGDPATDDVQNVEGHVVTPLAQRRAASVEFWFVDQEASVWIDGRRVLRKRFDYPLEVLKQRPEPGPMILRRNWPAISVSITGGAAKLAHVELDRDLYYSVRGTLEADARGALYRRGERWVDRRLDIGPDQFFCIGDNGPLSHDGRFWGLSGTPHTDPWIVHRMFDDQLVDGIVPRDLMMGRAFFVYWPAPYPFQDKPVRILPNFADMRFIH
ncbi:MAG: signal peptidase I [Phycisphaeraceae bacterium]|nr:signal peptidase I [Phycisphaeraceae bacterium]